MMQVLFNGLLTAALACLAGLGFALIYRTARFFDFSYGAVITAGAYLAFLFKTWLGLPLALSIPLAIAASAGLGMMLELSVYRPLRRREAPPLIAMLASLGVYTVLQNLVSLVFGDETQRLRDSTAVAGVDLFGAIITGVQATTIVIGTALTALLSWWIKASDLGKAMRAVANNPFLARVSGLDSDRIVLWAFAIGSCLAGVAGILIALDVDLTPTMGMNAMLIGMVAVIIGGVERLAGVVSGALVLGLAQQFGVWFVGAEWRDLIAFGVLFGFLLFRPQGFLGKPVRRATV